MIPTNQETAQCADKVSCPSKRKTKGSKIPVRTRTRKGKRKDDLVGGRDEGPDNVSIKVAEDLRQDLPDIFTDMNLDFIDVATSSSGSVSPQSVPSSPDEGAGTQEDNEARINGTIVERLVKLAEEDVWVSSEEEEGLILEAPEEFRSSHEDHQSSEPEKVPSHPPNHEDHNIVQETGDTTQQTPDKEHPDPTIIEEGTELELDLEHVSPDRNPSSGSAAATPAPPMALSSTNRPCAAPPSIGNGAADLALAQAPGCSRVPTTSASTALHADPPISPQDSNSDSESELKPLAFHFRNGRLVFEDPDLLLSRNLNKRPQDTTSRLKHLEHKLKLAGITDSNNNNNDKTTFCQFDVRNLDSLPDLDLEVYDELDDAAIHDLNMGVDNDRSKHNPDRDNLKSLLKKPGRNRDKKNRVVFNETKNEFFDADYIILIREECDYDEEEDDGVCTCNQHEMVRLTCCEPNCNCSYEGYDQTPQSPKFAPPIEFVDAVTLSPPEGYKDMELGEQQLLALQQMARRSQSQRQAVCRECSASHEDEDEDEGEASDCDGSCEQLEEKEKTDQSQQTTPTTPPNDSGSPNQKYILETISMTTVTEQKILREVEEERKIPSPSLPPGGSPISGILKGGRLWKQQSSDLPPKPSEPQLTDSSITSDEESSKRSVRFIESEDRDTCDGAPELPPKESQEEKEKEPVNENGSSPESTEMTLTFKLGNHVLISNNSLKPNSAVRQLFPCTKPLGKAGEEEGVHQYLVTAESLKAFEEAKRAKLPQIIQSGETDESIKRAIERNTLRRSLIRYEPKSKKAHKTDNSLVERIKQLTCNVDEAVPEEEIPSRVSPPGEECKLQENVNTQVPTKTFSPSSSSTTSSNSSMSSTYRKITDLFGKKEKTEQGIDGRHLPDIGGPHNHEAVLPDIHSVAKANATNERRQFLSTLAPLTACVSAMGNPEEYYYHMSNQIADRNSMASSVGTEYSLEDIDEGLKSAEDDSKRIAPDVLAGTPSASESGDELAMFVQQDASRIERIKKKYQSDAKDEDDEHDDYGFNKRPSVRGIKPRFGSTTEILQQIQNQLQPPVSTARVAWPYYSESGLSGVDNAKRLNQNYHVPEEMKARGFVPQYRPTSLQDENMYQNCASNQRCVYRANVNTYSTVMRVGGGCNEYYQSLPRVRGGRPQSPPPLEVSKNYHQTMVYIPYNHIEGYQPVSSPTPGYYHQDYARVSNQNNQINKRYIEPIYQQHYGLVAKPLRPPYSNTSRSESPLPGQFSTARSTQTPVPSMGTCNYYPRYRPMVGGGAYPEPTYVSKINRHSFPAACPRYPNPDSISLTDSESHYSVQLPNGYSRQTDINFPAQNKDSIPSSPTKSKLIERGVPEGAASVSPQDSQSTTSTMTSPTSPQNSQPGKPLFYAMNV